MKTKFDMIGIFVSDLKRMVEFYSIVPGVEIEWNSYQAVDKVVICQQPDNEIARFA